MVAQTVRKLPAMQNTQVRSLGQEDPLEKGMATHSSILAWRIPRIDEPGGLQSMALQRVWHNWKTFTSLYTYMHMYITNPLKNYNNFYMYVCVYTHTHKKKMYLAWKYDCSKSAIDPQITFCTVREFIKTEAKVSLSDLLKHEVMILRMSCICHLCDAETLCIKADHPNL